jgi:tetratricopeptide (TPR) repeat protein
MKTNQKENPASNAALISAMGKKSINRTNFRSVLSLHDEDVRKGTDTAGAHARRSIAVAMGIHSGELDASDTKKCLYDLDEALKLNKDLAIVQIAEGCYYYYCVKDFEKAITSFKNASVTDPGSHKPLFYLAMVYKTIGNWKELKLLLPKLEKFKIQNPLSLTNIGICYEYLHDFDLAIKFHQKAMDADPDWEAAYLNMVTALILKGKKTSEARTVLNKLIKITKEEYIEYQIMLDIYDEEYKVAYSKTINAMTCDFSYIGDRSLYLGNISNLLNDKAKADKYYDCALKELELELNADPDNSEIQGMKALALAGKGNKIAAVEEGEKALEIAGKGKNKALESERIINLAQVYTRLGMFKEAIEKINQLFSSPCVFSTKILQVDPAWKPLLDTPELKKIIAVNNNKMITL